MKLLRTAAPCGGKAWRREAERRLMRRLDCLPQRELVIELRRARTALSLGGYKSALPS